MNQYLVFSPGQTQTSVIFTGQTPPNDGNTYIFWNQINGDQDPSHYLLQYGSLVYSGPSVEITKFYTAILADANLSPTAKFYLSLTQPLMVPNINNPQLMNTFWQTMCSNSDFSAWLDTATQQEVVNLAQQYNIPLTMPPS